MSWLIDRIAPRRLGPGFRWLLGSAWVSNIGDGVALAAGPLLVASQTSDPLLVAAAGLAQRLPGLLFGLWAGAIADRVDRRVVVRIADSLRAVVVAVLGATILTDAISIWMIIATMFVFGVAETFADTATGAILPMVVERPDLGLATSRINGGFIVADQMLGPPIGAFLFSVGMVWPIAVQVVAIILAVLLIGRIDVVSNTVPREQRTQIRREIAEGVRWLIGHRAVRMLAIVILSFNITWGAAWSVLVLYAKEHLGMGDVGFGLLTTASAFGGLLATAVFSRLERRVSLKTMMRVCLTLEVLHHLALALTTRPWVALVIMFVFGLYAFVWGTLGAAVRQRAVPNEFQGRVSSVYRVGMLGGLVIGQALGGVIARQWGLTAPFWFAFVGSAVTLALVWRSLADIAHADASTA